MKFALYFGNRGFFPESLVASARKEMIEAVTRGGHSYISMEETRTKFGAITSAADGYVYAQFLKEHEGEYDGVIMCLPNFSDENGAVAAMRDAGKPILIQAYPDEIGHMSFEERRDAFCGKFSIEDCFTQYGIPFSVFPPHVCHPLSPEFADQLTKFAGVCRVVNGMKRFSIGAIGARTSLFKTVRFDELALEKYGVTVDSFDLSELFDNMNKMKTTPEVLQTVQNLKDYTDFSHVPEDKTILMAKCILCIIDYVKEWKLDSLALRCWNEFPIVMGISACTVISYLNHMGIPCSCELDVCNTLAMRALTLATENVSTVLDWNNNYGTQTDKCILFHCGPVAQDMMEAKGTVTDHKMFAKSWGAGCAWGVNEGRIKKGQFTFASAKTTDGKIQMYLGEGDFTGEPIEKVFFGAAGVAHIENLENILMYVGRNGYRHHVSVAFGDAKAILEEAFNVYLHYDVNVF